MQKIETILKEALLSGEGVFLPGVGALVVDRHSAVVKGENVLAPRYSIALWPDGKEGAYSIVDYMLKTPGTERDIANRTYETWLKEATDVDGSVMIDGIGEIKNGGFAIVPAFDAILNPNVNKCYLIRRKRSYAVYWIFGVVLLATTLISLCVWLFCNGIVKEPAKQWPTVENAVATSGVVAGTAMSTNIIGKGTDSLSASPSAAVAATEPAVAVPADADRYYVVLGVFADPANADMIIQQTLVVNGNLRIEKLSYKGKTMVTIYSSIDRADATANMRRLRSVNPDVWVYHRE